MDAAMKLWEVDDGTTYWCAAEDEAGAMQLAGIHLGDVDRDEVDVRELDEPAGSKITFHDPSGDTRSMWAEFRREPHARLLACSDY